MSADSPGAKGPADDGSGDTPARAPLIDYPTFYTFKAMGLAGPDLRGRIVAHVAGVLGAVEDAAVTVRPSSAGKYESISVHVYLRSEDQRRRIYHAFHNDKTIVWYV